MLFLGFGPVLRFLQVRGLHWASRGSCEVSYTNKPLGERHTESPGLRAGLGLAGSMSPQKPFPGLGWARAFRYPGQGGLGPGFRDPGLVS